MEGIDLEDRSRETTQKLKDVIYLMLEFTKNDNYLDDLENVRSLVDAETAIRSLFNRL